MGRRGGTWLGKAGQGKADKARRRAEGCDAARLGVVRRYMARIEAGRGRAKRRVVRLTKAWRYWVRRALTRFGNDWCGGVGGVRHGRVWCPMVWCELARQTW